MLSRADWGFSELKEAPPSRKSKWAPEPKVVPAGTQGAPWIRPCRWRGGKKEVTMTCFAHVLYTYKLAIGTSQKFGIIFYHQIAYHCGYYVEKHSLLYFWQFFPWCNVRRASLARFRAADHDATGRQSHGVARWRGGKKEVTMTCFAHVLYTHKLAIGTSQKFCIILYHQFSYNGGNFVEKHSLLYFW